MPIDECVTVYIVGHIYLNTAFAQRIGYFFQSFMGNTLLRTCTEYEAENRSHLGYFAFAGYETYYVDTSVKNFHRWGETAYSRACAIDIKYRNNQCVRG